MPGFADHHGDEREQLLAYLAQQRYFLRLTAYGLSDEQAFRLGPDESLTGVLDEYADVATETERVVRRLPLDHPVPVPGGVPWFPGDVAAWTLRWVLLHIVEETARHVGHADIVRESLDGATWFPLMAAAENAPPSPWVEPWRPA